MWPFNKKISHPKPSELKKFLPFKHLSQEDLFLLSLQTEIRQIKSGKKIFKHGSKDKWTYFLLDGELQLKDKQKKEAILRAGTEQASTAISHLQPRHYTAFTTKASRLIRLNKTLLDNIKPESQELSSSLIEDSNIKKATYQNNAFFKQVFSDLISNRLQFPQLPINNKKLLKEIKRAKKASVLAAVIQCHPFLTAKIIKTANGPLFYTLPKVESCVEAIKRLEIDATKQICAGILQSSSDNPLSNPELSKRLNMVLEQSLKTAAIAKVCGKLQKGFDENQTMLAGLLHNIGSYVVLQYADNNPEFLSSADDINQALNQLSPELGSMILQQWNFSEPLINVAKDAANWKRNTVEEADISDVVLVSRAYYFISKKMNGISPPLKQIPAFLKLKMDKLSPKFSMKLLNQAAKELAPAKSFL